MSTFQNTKEVEATAKARMEKVLADLQHDVSSIRTGRASINMLEPVQVEAYGSLMPLSHVATLHVPEPGMITAQPFDSSQINAIEKAIRNAGLGLNPGNDGKLNATPQSFRLKHLALCHAHLRLLLIEYSVASLV